MRCPDLRIGCASVGTVLLLVACGGGGGDIISPFWTHSGLVVADIDDDGRVDAR